MALASAEVDLHDAILVFHTLQLREAERRLEVLTQSIVGEENLVESQEVVEHHRERLRALRRRSRHSAADLAEFRRWTKQILDA